MAYMSEVSSSRFDASRHLQRLVDTEMGRMRLLPQGIDDERFHTFDFSRNSGRDFAAITEIGDELLALSRKEIAVHGRVPVRDGQRRNLRFAQEEWTSDDVRFGFEVSWERIERFESELEDTLQILHRFRRGVNWHEAALVCEAPQIVEPH